MNLICVKLNKEKKQKYRKMLTTDKDIYPDFNPKSISRTEYKSGAELAEGEYFFIEKASKQDYKIDLMDKKLSAIDFDSLNRKDFGKIDFLFVFTDKNIFFQKIAKSKLVSKKSILCFGEEYKYEDNIDEITINNYPDAIYDKDTDTLYFQRLEAITSIFKGIDQLYREATNEETEEFLKNDFISLTNDYTATNVKTANRKRIALASEILKKLDETKKKNIFSYMSSYLAELKKADNAFTIGSENDLKLVLFGIDERFYTTIVGGEKRIANSVISFNQGTN